VNGGATRVSELTWYSRFAVWVGAVVLLVQAIAGRGAGLMSLIATLLLGLGLVVFLVGLVADARRPGAIAAGPVEEAADAAVEAETPATLVESRSEPEPVDSIPVERSAAVSESDAAPAELATPGTEPAAREAAPVSVDAPKPTPRRAAPRIATERLDIESPLLGELCVHCGEALTAGEVVAVCPVCFEPQHGACWVENHFRCSTPGCTGAGRLQAPDRVV
jgi:hypothetical protein